jgi:hypothetical protein
MAWRKAITDTGLGNVEVGEVIGQQEKTGEKERMLDVHVS